MIAWSPTTDGLTYYEASAGICSLTVWQQEPAKEWRWSVEIFDSLIERDVASTREAAMNAARDTVVSLVVQIQGEL